MTEDSTSHEGSCFQPLAGMRLVFDPFCSGKTLPKKNPCPDCSHCQFCSDDRCQTCRGKKNGSNKSRCRKLTLKEQIALYERLNSHGRDH